MIKLYCPFIDEYPEDFAWCYGCGRMNAEGHHFGWSGDETVTFYQPRLEHKAVLGFVYGGLLASLVDCHSTGSASLALHRTAKMVLSREAGKSRRHSSQLLCRWISRSLRRKLLG